ncbi:MAG: sigma-70 family RNA polymerase sigma factor [Chloroflexi bacterium]|nr:sigma-70 family RNA polymerase sigma factor [Chloroflexota bacterium]
MAEEKSDRLLFEAIQYGSPPERKAAEEALHSRYKDVVRRHIRRNVPPPDAVDLEQTVWMEVIQGARKVRLRFESAAPWILGIARKKVAEFYRRPKPPTSSLQEGMASEGRIAEPLEERENILELRMAWRALTPEQRLVVFLADIVGAPLSEVARWVGRSEQAIYEMHRRAKEAIRSLLWDIQQGHEPQSQWLAPSSHTYVVIDLHPALGLGELQFLAEGTGVEPDLLLDSFEFGMALYVERTPEYLEAVDRHFALFHLVLLSREGLEEYLAGTGEGCDAYVFQMTLEDDCLTPDPRYQALKMRAGWRLRPTEGPE